MKNIFATRAKSSITHNPCKFLPFIVPRRFPKFIFSRLWPPPIPHSVSCELIRKILKKVREREKKKYELCLVSYKVEGKFLLKKIWRSFSLFCFGHERFFRISLMKIWKREEAHTHTALYYFSRFVSLSTIARLFSASRNTPRCVMWLNILNLGRNNFLTIKFTPKLIVTLSTGHVPANERTSWEFIMFSSRDLMRVESRKHSATISKVKLDILK